MGILLYISWIFKWVNCLNLVDESNTNTYEEIIQIQSKLNIKYVFIKIIFKI